MLLIVYVDDMKLAGPKKHIVETWKQLGQHVKLEEPKGNANGIHTFLGCTHRKISVKLPNGCMASAMEYDVEDFVGSCVEKYVALCDLFGQTLAFL